MKKEIIKLNRNKFLKVVKLTNDSLAANIGLIKRILDKLAIEPEEEPKDYASRMIEGQREVLKEWEKYRNKPKQTEEHKQWNCSKCEVSITMETPIGQDLIRRHIQEELEKVHCHAGECRHEPKSKVPEKFPDTGEPENWQIVTKIDEIISYLKEKEGVE